MKLLNRIGKPKFHYGKVILEYKKYFLKKIIKQIPETYFRKKFQKTVKDIFYHLALVVGCT